MVTTPLLPLEPDIGILREGTRSFWPQISPDKLPPVKDPVKPVVREALAETPAVERGQEEEEEEHEGAEKALLRLPRRRPPPPPPPLGRRAPQDKIREGTVTSMARWWRAVVRRNGAFSLEEVSGRYVRSAVPRLRFRWYRKICTDFIPFTHQSHYFLLFSNMARNFKFLKIPHKLSELQIAFSLLSLDRSSLAKS